MAIGRGRRHLDSAGERPATATGAIHVRSRHVVFCLKILRDHARQHILKVAGGPRTMKVTGFSGYSATAFPANPTARAVIPTVASLDGRTL